MFARFEAFATREELTGAMEALLAGDNVAPRLAAGEWAVKSKMIDYESAGVGAG